MANEIPLEELSVACRLKNGPVVRYQDLSHISPREGLGSGRQTCGRCRRGSRACAQQPLAGPYKALASFAIYITTAIQKSSTPLKRCDDAAGSEYQLFEVPITMLRAVWLQKLLSRQIRRSPHSKDTVKLRTVPTVDRNPNRCDYDLEMIWLESIKTVGRGILDISVGDSKYQYQCSDFEM